MRLDELVIERYSADYKEKWELFCAEVSYSTILHKREFLAYHKCRYEDWSILIFHNFKIVSIMSAAKCNENNSMVVSHPGATFGGLLFKDGEPLINRDIILLAVKQFYKKSGFNLLLYKQVPLIYRKERDESDSYIMFKHGAKQLSCDLSSTIFPAELTQYSKRRIRSIKRAAKLQIRVVHNSGDIVPFWRILTDRLWTKYNKKPVHSIAEIKSLMEIFSDNMHLSVAYLGDTLIAGSLLIESAIIMHAQYIASDTNYLNSGGLDLIFHELIAESFSKNKPFDFGISTTNRGYIMNEGLHKFKSEFGAQNTCYNQYILELA